MAGDNPSSWGSWQDVPTGEQNVVNSLLDQWRQTSGYYGDVPDWAKLAMAQEGISSTYMMGQFMTRHVNNAGYPAGSAEAGAYFVNPEGVRNAPWSQFGMTADAFFSTLSSYQALMLQYTGTGGTADDFASKLRATNGQLTSSFITESLLHDPNMMNTYGWLKYGMTYDQFQQQKQQMTQAFGQTLDDAEAVKQLEYWHQNASASQAAKVAQTLTQVEKQEAYTGPKGAGAVVR